MSDGLRPGRDGRQRCRWSGDDPLYRQYHDHEWGRPVTDDVCLFENLCLEGFQAGLSWLTILRKRQNFRTAFSGFDIGTVAAFTSDDVERLMSDAGIVRNQQKIVSAINNAQLALEIISEHTSLAAYLWRWAPSVVPARREARSLPTTTAESHALAKDLKRRGWSFIGPTTVYAFMQSAGLVNDHLEGCFAFAECTTERAAVAASLA